MSYTYNNGDGVSVLDTAEPNGAIEPVSNLDDAIKQIKKWIRDTTSNVGAAGMQSAIVALQASIAALQASVAGGSVAGSSLFKANSAANQDVVFGGAASIDTTIVFGSVEFNPDSVFATNKFTAPAAGYYQFTTKVHLEVAAGSPTGNSFLLTFLKNGTGIESIGEDLAGVTYVGGQTSVIQLALGDEIQVQCSIEITGGSGTWRIVANNTSFQGFRLR